MSQFITVTSDQLTFEIFTSARVPLLYKKKFGIGMLKDAESLVMDAEKSVWLIHQSYLAKCIVMGEKPEITEDKILDFIPAVELMKTSFTLIQSFTKEIEGLSPKDEVEKKT